MGSESAVIELDRPGQIQVQVLDQKTGQPVRGITLSAHGDKSSVAAYRTWPATATTNERGEATFTQFPPMQFIVSGIGASAPRSDADLAGVVLRRPGITLKEGATLRDIKMTWTQGCLLRGRALDQKTGKGVVDARLYASQKSTAASQSENTWSASFEIDADGRFKIRVPEGETTLFAYADEYLSQPQEERKTIQATADTETDAITLTLTPKSSLKVTGTVVDSKKRPVAGAQVYAGYRYNESGDPTDTKGRFELPAMRGRSSAQMESDMLIHALLPDKNLVGVVQIAPEAEGVFDATIQLAPGGSLTGRIVDEAGKPLSGIQVQLRKRTNLGNGFRISSLREPFKTDAEGRFTINCLGDAQLYGLHYTAEGYGAWEDHDITGKAGETVDKGDITLARADYNIEGIVADPGGNPVPGVRISGYGDGQPEYIDAESDDDGKFQIGPLAKGEINLSTSKTGYVNASLRGMEVAEVAKTPLKIELAQLPGGVSGPDGGGSAPALEQIEWLHGQNELQSRKNRPIVLVFSSTTNRAGRAALGRLHALSTELGPEKFSVLAIHDSSASAAEIQTFWVKNQYTFALGRVTQEKKSGLYSPSFRAYGVDSLPKIILVGANGKIVDSDVNISDLDKTVRLEISLP